MGGVTSKSPLERRNTVARRSQRRTLHNVKAKIDNVYKDIKKFKGTSIDANYASLKNEIEYLKTDLERRSKDLQPQLRFLFETIYKRICEAEDELNQKLLENQEKLKEKEAKQKTKEDDKNSKSNGSVLSDNEDPDRIEILSNVSTVYPDSHIEENEAKGLENSKEKRRTVELKVVKVVPSEDRPMSPKESNFRTPEEKRKSILKTGVAVMPGAILKEMFSSTKKMLKHSDSTNSKVQFEEDVKDNNTVVDSGKETLQVKPKQATPWEISEKINEYIKYLQNTEIEISEFVGKKNGKIYNKIKHNLEHILTELHDIQPKDEDNIDQQNQAISYVQSCLNFLDERATDDVKKSETYSIGDDEVFYNNNVPMAKRQPSVEDILKLQSLMKNTPV